MSNEHDQLYSILGLTDYLFDKLKAHADSKGVNLSVFMRQILIDAMDNLPEKPAWTEEKGDSMPSVLIELTDGREFEITPDETTIVLHQTDPGYDFLIIGYDVNVEDDEIASNYLFWRDCINDFDATVVEMIAKNFPFDTVEEVSAAIKATYQGFKLKQAMYDLDKFFFDRVNALWLENDTRSDEDILDIVRSEFERRLKEFSREYLS